MHEGMGSLQATFESVIETDEELARVSLAAGALRLSLGAGLEALAQISGHHEMGFSSIEAYALERCERSSRWVQQSRSAARGLAKLPALRLELIDGRITFSMAQLLAKVACPEDEQGWLDLAEGRTVRELQRF